MPKLLRFAASLVMLFGGVALAAGGGIALNTGTRFEFTDCASGGSSSQAITPGKYMARFTDESVFVCYAGTCAAGGEKFPAGLAFVMTFGGGITGTTTTTLSCRSAGSTGDFILTKAD